MLQHRRRATVSVDSSISFFRSTQGAALTATAVCDKPGRHLGFYTVTVEDDLGKQIAKMTATCYANRGSSRFREIGGRTGEPYA